MKSNKSVAEYMTNPKYCAGCEWYCWYGDRTCDYTYRTGKIRIGTTAHCKVRRAKKRGGKKECASCIG